MGRSGPLVSVIIPAYNAERFIDETLESVFKQPMTISSSSWSTTARPTGQEHGCERTAIGCGTSGR